MTYFWHRLLRDHKWKYSCMYNGIAYFDEVGLIEWTPWQNVDQLQSLLFPNDYYWAQVQGTENPKSIRLSYTEKELFSSLPDRSIVIHDKIITNLTNYPNPFNPDITISFLLKQDTKLELSVYNIKGQKVKTLVQDNLAKGLHKLVWDGKDSVNKQVASGIYFYKINASGSVKTRKIILMK